MKPHHAALWIALASLAAASSCSSVPRGDARVSKAQFERLKSLDGAWVTTTESEGAPAGVEILYHVSAGGSTLVETILPGAPEEMVSIYHIDGPRLVMTHYCSAGNQPFMVAREGGDDSIVFECVGGANVDKEHGLYMQRAEFRFLSDARVDASWTAYRDGKPDHTARFALVRSWR